MAVNACYKLHLRSESEWAQKKCCQKAEKKSRKIEIENRCCSEKKKQNNCSDNFLILTSHKLHQFVVIVVWVIGESQSFKQHANVFFLMHIHGCVASCLFYFYCCTGRSMLGQPLNLFISLWWSSLWCRPETELEQNRGPSAGAFWFCLLLCSSDLLLFRKGYQGS